MRGLVEMTQTPPQNDVEVIEDDPPEVPAGQPEPTMNDRDSELAEGEDGQDEPELVEHKVVEQSVMSWRHN